MIFVFVKVACLGGYACNEAGTGKIGRILVRV